VGIGLLSSGSLLPAIMDHVFNRRTFLKNSGASLRLALFRRAGDRVIAKADACAVDACLTDLK
jgi:hypothetical protein